MATRFGRSVSIMMVATALGVVAVPPPSYARHYDLAVDVTHHAAHDIGQQVAIGAGITTGVAALVGAALWYYFRHRHDSTPTATEVPPPPPSVE